MERKEIMAKVQDIFRDVLDNEEIVLTNGSCADDIEEWDSLSHVQLIVEIEKTLGIKFTSKEILHWDNVGQMLDTIYEKLK
jgi:acyl carrier protein